tara:strand:- start:1788 stop:1928 length:141 start_codon:yes stop_codon:yes gene_type:complete
MEVDITLEELVAEMDQTFNKELTISLQRVQIRKLQQIIDDKKEEAE